MDSSRFCSRLALLPRIPPDVNAQHLWLQLLPQQKRLSGAHALGHPDFFSAMCDWLVRCERLERLDASGDGGCRYIDVSKQHFESTADVMHCARCPPAESTTGMNLGGSFRTARPSLCVELSRFTCAIWPLPLQRVGFSTP
jgi:hypothetical protein